MFSVALYMLRQTLCRLGARCPVHHTFPSFSDVADDQSYSASTVRARFLLTRDLLCSLHNSDVICPCVKTRKRAILKIQLTVIILYNKIEG
jgi:hypothetical protein